MSRVPAIMLLAVIGLTAGCASEQQYLEQGQANATATALDRGRFELNCPAATATVLSQELVQPQAVALGAFPVSRSEYTVGVSGCGQRATYVVICPARWRRLLCRRGRRNGRWLGRCK